MDRAILTDLRPLIPEALVEHSLELEQFQNTVLRPVIKFQHELICAHVQCSPHFNELMKNKGARIEFHGKVQGFISKQADLKHQLIGIVLGLLTLDEYSMYQSQSQEHNKRIVRMIVQRISDTFY